MSLKFVNLHGHDGQSVYDGIGAPEDYAEWMLKNAGEDSGALAITNHGNMNSIGDIIQSQKKYDKKGAPVKFIYGVEAYYLPSLDDWRKVKLETDEKKKEDKKRKKKNDDTNDLVIENEAESKSKYFEPVNRRNHLVLCATTQEGLRNLFTLVTRSYRYGFFKKPRMDLNMLRQFNKGIIASTACLAGVPSWCSLQSPDDLEASMKMYDQEVLPLMDIFGKDRFFLELQFNKIPEQQIVNSHVWEYAKRTGYNLIATADSHYPAPDMWKTREMYRILGYRMQKEDPASLKRLIEKDVKDLDCELYLKNGDQLFEAYKKSPFFDPSRDQTIKEAIERTYHIAHDVVEKIYPDDSIKLPKTFQVTENIKTGFDKLKGLCFEGLKKKNLTTKEYINRAAYELGIIKKLGVSEYFLAKRQGLQVLRTKMLTGTGRGSGAGSLVNYLLDITFVDPIKHNLLFERFLSPSRAEMPDIDSDCESKDVAFEALQEFFGEESVLAITNYNRLQLKSLIKDLSDVYGVEFQEVNRVTKNIENEARDKILDEIGGDQKFYELNFESAMKYSPTFRRYMEKYPEVGEHVEGLYREVKSIGRHAGGVFIIPEAERCLPIFKIRDTYQSPISEGLTVHHAEHFGLVKFDYLALATLRIIRKCIEFILIDQGNENPIIDDVWGFYNKYLHPDVMDTKDQKVFQKTYQAGKFPSIFQFAERGVQNFCVQAAPASVAEISAITSLWRPGPLKGEANIRYLGAKEKDILKDEHPIIQEVMKDTNGVLLYQEQFMILANKLAGFTLEEANTLRKLLVRPTTSLAEEMKKERIEIGEKFINGCMEKGLTKERAEKLWHEEIMGFISYGFNKSLLFSELITIYEVEGHLEKTIEHKLPIEEICKNKEKYIPKNGKGKFFLKSRDETTKENSLIQLKDVHDHGKIDVYEFELDDGRKVRCSKDHKFRVEDGRMLPIWQIMKENLDIVVCDADKNSMQD